MKLFINGIVVVAILCSLAACAAQPEKERALVQEERAEAFWNRVGQPSEAR